MSIQSIHSGQSVQPGGWGSTYNAAVGNFTKINEHNMQAASDLVNFTDKDVRQRRRGERKELLHKFSGGLKKVAHWRKEHLPLPWDKNDPQQDEKALRYLEHKMDQAITFGRIGYAALNPNPLSFKGALEEITFQAPDVIKERIQGGWFDFPPA